MAPRRQTTFPVAETLGIFLGVVSWDLLTEGQIEVVKALLVTAPASLVWYGWRSWRERIDQSRH